MESSHSFKIGDVILVSRPTGSVQDWMVAGHPGTIAQQQNASGQSSTTTTGPQNFFWPGFLQTANPQSAKPKVTQTTYPADGTPTWTNPGQTVQVQIASQPDVRQFFDQKAGQYNFPALYQSNLWKQGMHILQSSATGSPITQIIQQLDQTLTAEAQGSGQALQMLHRLRTELNTSNFNGFLPNANNGLVQTFQSLLSGGGLSGLGNIQGLLGNLLGAFSSFGTGSINIGTLQNTAMNTNNLLSAAGTAITQAAA
jgi:hypothetical protein